MQKELTPGYVDESIPKKTYTKKFSLRPRKKMEFFWDEIFIAVLIIIMLFMLFINSMQNNTVVYDDLPEENVINIGVEIESDTDFAQPLSNIFLKGSTQVL